MFTLADAFAALGREVPDGSRNVQIDGIQIDSRLDVRDRLFVAIRTESADGNTFVGDAFMKGAAAAVLQQSTWEWPYGRQLVVEDSVAALAKIGRYVRLRSSNVKVIGITGSNGKTTTKQALAAALSAAGSVVSSERSFNNELGIPITLAEIDLETDYAVVEMGAQVVGEIAGYCQMAAPDVGIITNVGRAHIGLFGSDENVAQAKGELAEAVGVDGSVVLNRDDAWSKSIRDRTRATITWFGESEDADVVGRYSELPGFAGGQVELKTRGDSATLGVPAVGRHLAPSFAAAVACGQAMGIDFGILIEGLGRFVPPKHRMEVKSARGFNILDDSHNANRDSMLYALDQLRRAKVGGRKLAVLGDMLELGEFADEDHAAVGQAAAFVDELFTIGDKSEVIGKSCGQAGLDVRQIHHYPSDPFDSESIEAPLSALADRLRAELREGDVLLIKGSNALGLHQLADRIRRDGR